MTHPRLQMRGPLARFAHCVQLAGEPAPASTWPLGHLYRADSVPPMLAGYLRSQPPAPRRALLSQWSKGYLAAWLVPQLGLRYLAGWQLPLQAQQLWLDAEGAVSAFCYADAGCPAGAVDDEQCWHAWLEGLLRPTLPLMARYGGVSVRVLWNSAGNLLEAICRQLPQGEALQARWLQAERWPWQAAGERNPLRQPVHYVPPLLPERDTAPTRLRRLCCLRYEIPGQVYCATCPHLTRLEHDELETLWQHWRHED